MRVFSIFYIICEHEIDDSKEIHKFLNDGMQKKCLAMFEDHLCLVEDVINLREYLLDLMEGMLFLDIMKSALNIHNLELDHMQYLLDLVVEVAFLLVSFENHRMSSIYLFIPSKILLFPKNSHFYSNTTASLSSNKLYPITSHRARLKLIFSYYIQRLFFESNDKKMQYCPQQAKLLPLQPHHHFLICRKRRIAAYLSQSRGVHQRWIMFQYRQAEIMQVADLAIPVKVEPANESAKQRDE